MPESSAQTSTTPVRSSAILYTRGGNRAFHNYYNDYSHIDDANLRRRLALSDVDKVPFGTCHIRAVLVTGAGFLLDSYSIFAINFAAPLIGLAYYSDDKNVSGALPFRVCQAFKVSMSAGIAIGMLLFGWLADTYGRRRMYGIQLGVVLFTLFSSAIASGSPSMSSSGVLMFWRLLMSIGIGGDYPLASVITAEFAPTRWRGGMVAAVFSMQGFGQLLAAVVGLITTTAFRSSYDGIGPNDPCDASCRIAADRSWRIIVAVGAVPACLAMYYRYTIPETPRYTFDVEHDVDRADADIRDYVSSGRPQETKGTSNNTFDSPSLSLPKASWADAKKFFLKPRNMRALIGTTLSWFFLDLAYYGLGLNNHVILHAIGYASGQTLYHKLRNQAVGLIILACAGSVPGYWTAVLAVDTFGRKPLQIIGFLSLAIMFCILGFAVNDVSEGTLFALYIIGQFLFNAGPNTTTFIVPSECFPTRYRATAHGLSAAMGKLGAIVAQCISIPLLKKVRPLETICQNGKCTESPKQLLQLFALFMLIGTLVSLLIPETKGITLEELSGEPHTSYNDGCNGSIKDMHRSLPWWHPFQLLGLGGSDGQPAGFRYHRSGGWGDGGGRASQRVGIMTCPQAAAAAAASNTRRKSFKGAPLWQRFLHGGWRSKHAEETDRVGIAMVGRRRSRHGGVDAVSDEASVDTAYAGGVQGESRHAHGASNASSSAGMMEAPTWGAGWGRIDRGGAAPTSELRDVGMLLKE